MKPNNVEKPAREQQRDSSYRGVRKRKWGKFVTEIRLPNSRQRIWLGSYDTAQKAARAFDAAMFCLRGTDGWFNFPDDLPDIAGERCMTPSHIRVVATRFANSEPQMDNSGRAVRAPVESEEIGLLPMESLSPPLSEVTIATDSDATSSGSSFHDLFSVAESGNYDSDYYAFLGFDDFNRDFYMPELPSFDYTEENTEGLIFQDSFLWNF